MLVPRDVYLFAAATGGSVCTTWREGPASLQNWFLIPDRVPSPNGVTHRYSQGHSGAYLAEARGQVA